MELCPWGALRLVHRPSLYLAVFSCRPAAGPVLTHQHKHACTHTPVRLCPPDAGVGRPGPGFDAPAVSNNPFLSGANALLGGGGGNNLWRRASSWRGPRQSESLLGRRSRGRKSSLRRWLGGCQSCLRCCSQSLRRRPCPGRRHPAQRWGHGGVGSLLNGLFG